MQVDQHKAEAGGHGWELNLLGGWHLKRYGEPVWVGIRQQRLIAALALLGPKTRAFLAALLWPESTAIGAQGNLSAGILEITEQLPDLLYLSDDSPFLNPDVRVDYHRVLWLISDIDDGEAPMEATAVFLNVDVLPGWHDDWVLFFREQFQQRRLHALETLAEHFLRSGDTKRATDAALVAVSIEPLRENAHLLLVRAYLEGGNAARALQTFSEFKRKLGSELGVSPTHRFVELLEVQPAHPPVP